MKVYVVTAESTVSDYGRLCFLGCGRTEADAILDARGLHGKLASCQHVMEFDSVQEALECFPNNDYEIECM